MIITSNDIIDKIADYINIDNHTHHVLTGYSSLPTYTCALMTLLGCSGLPTAEKLISALNRLPYDYCCSYISVP